MPASDLSPLSDSASMSARIARASAAPPERMSWPGMRYRRWPLACRWLGCARLFRGRRGCRGRARRSCAG
jgi:hypothetical protein